MTNTHITIGGHKVSSGAKFVKLWENPNPSSSFASTSFSLPNASEYDRLSWEFKFASGNVGVGLTVTTTPSTTRGCAVMNDFNTQYSVFYEYGRSFSLLNGTVSIEDGHQWRSDTGMSTQNSLMIPVAIYGIKF